MIFILMGVVALLILWVIVTAIQGADRKRREELIRKHKEEKAKEDDKSPFPH